MPGELEFAGGAVDVAKRLQRHVLLASCALLSTEVQPPFQRLNGSIGLTQVPVSGAEVEKPDEFATRIVDLSRDGEGVFEIANGAFALAQRVVEHAQVHQRVELARRGLEFSVLRECSLVVPQR